MSHDELACREFVELLTEYFEGALAPEECKRFEDHLARCRGCCTYLEQMRQTMRLLGSLSESSVPQEGREELLRLFRDWKQGRSTNAPGT